MVAAFLVGGVDDGVGGVGEVDQVGAVLGRPDGVLLDALQRIVLLKSNFPLNHQLMPVCWLVGLLMGQSVSWSVGSSVVFLKMAESYTSMHPIGALVNQWTDSLSNSNQSINYMSFINK